MKLQFQDTLEPTSIDIPIDLDQLDNNMDMSAGRSKVTWSLKIDVESFGIGEFLYELVEAEIPIMVYKEGSMEEEIKAHITHRSTNHKRGYFCRLFSDQLKENKWCEKEIANFPITLKIKEDPLTEKGKRSQIFVKHIELDLTSGSQTITLTI